MVRKQCNRYKETPHGPDYKDVLKRAKAFYKDGVFYISKFMNTYTAERPSIGFKDPDNAIYYKKVNHKWVQL